MDNTISLSKKERETHIFYNEIDQIWEIDTSIKKHISIIKKKKWEIIQVDKNSNGVVTHIRAYAPGNAITFRVIKDFNA